MEPRVQPATSTELSELVRALEAVGDCRARPELTSAVLLAMRPSSHALAPHLYFRARRYTRILIHRTHEFELLLVCWSRGARSPIHDHDDQDCWMLPLAGALDLDDYVAAPGHLVTVERRTNVRTLDHRPTDAQIHRVSAATAAAVSLHLYARPLERCRVFDLRGHWRWRALSYDYVAC